MWLNIKICVVPHQIWLSICLQIAPQINLTDDEIDYRMRMEYQAYLEEETAFLRHLGILDELSTPGKIPIEAN